MGQVEVGLPQLQNKNGPSKGSSRGGSGSFNNTKPGMPPEAQTRIVKDITIPIEIDELAEEQSKDDYIQRIWRISLNKQSHDKRINKQDREDALNLRKLAGIIVKVVTKLTGDIRVRVVVPKSLQRRVVEKVHRVSHVESLGYTTHCNKIIGSEV